MIDQTPLASSKAVAEFIDSTPNALAKMRMEGTGPAFIRMGARNIKYRWTDVYAWLDANTHTTTDDYMEQSA